MKKGARPVLGMVLKGYPRISETFISNEIRLLEESGYKIHILSMRKPRESFTHDSVKAIKADVTYLPSTIITSLHRFMGPQLSFFLKQPRLWLSTFWRTLKRMTQTKKSATLKHFLQAVYLIEKGLRGRNITHLHAHFAHSPTSVAMLAAELYGISFSFTGHAKDIYTQRPAAITEKMAKAKFVVTCTGYNKKTLEELSPGGTPVSCVYHGIDLSLFENGDDVKKAAQPYTIMTVARMVEKKGLPTVLEALARLRDEGIDFRYVLIGDGELRRQTEVLAEKLGLADRLEITGTIPHKKVLEYYRKADLFVLGCRVAKNGDRDGIPNVIAEAMAMGVPVAATTVSGIPELIEHEKSGLLAPPKAPDDLAKNMRRLLSDQALRERIIPAAKERVHQVFDNQVLIRELVEVYNNAGLK